MTPDTTLLSATSPFSFVLFGASGNLAKLKIYPALYVLALKKRFPSDYTIIGYARTEMDDATFRALVGDAIRTDMIEVNEKILEEFLTHVHYQQGQYDDAKDFAALRTTLEKLEWKTPHIRLAYLSIPPTAFTGVLKLLCSERIRQKEGQFRCIVEKPVGNDLSSYEDIARVLHECFEESEVYLLDHYLGKEAVRNLYYLRFANPVLERLLKNTLIHHVEITASESLGLEGRAGYFEHTGTLRDMFQSHLLMMMSLLTMRLREESENIPQSRFNALEQIYLPPASKLSDVILQGQYAAGKIGREHVPAYTGEQGIEAHSRTNTFVALKLMTRIARWEGVPFYLKSGKRLDKKETRISIQFQMPHAVGTGAGPNRLDIILQGEAGMRLHLQTKVSGAEPTFRPLLMEDPLVCIGDCLPEHALLLIEAIHGNRQWYLSFNEVHTAWRLTDPLQTHLNFPATPLHSYAAGSTGPKEAEAWIARDGMKWF